MGDILITGNDSGAIRDAIGPKIADDAELNMSSLPPKYVEEKLKPELAKITERKKIEELKTKISTNKELLKLVEDYTFLQFSIGTVPGKTSWADQAREKTKSVFKTAETFIKEMSGSEDEKSKENRMIKEIIDRSMSVMAKFDRYVLQGDGKQKGNKTSWFGSDEKDLKEKINIKENKKVQGSVHDVMRDDMMKVLNEVGKLAMDDNLEGINFFGNTLKFDSKLQKLAFFASYLSAIEDGCDNLIPGVISQAVDAGAGAVGDVAFGTADKGADMLGGLGSLTLDFATTHYILSTLLITAAVSTIRGKSWGGKILRKGLLKGLRKIPKIGPLIPETIAPAPAPAGTAGATAPEGTATSVPEAAKTPVQLAREKAVLTAMFEQDKITQYRVVDDLYTAHSGDAEYAGITREEFREGVRNPDSFSRDKVLFQRLNADYVTLVKEVPGASAEPTFEAYKRSVFAEVGDVDNKLDYDNRIKKIGILKEKLKTPMSGAKQKKLIKELKAVIAGEYTPGKIGAATEALKKIVGRGSGVVHKNLLPEAIVEDIFKQMNLEAEADINKVKEFRKLLKNGAVTIDEVNTSFKELGSSEQGILKDEKNVRITELEGIAKTEMGERILKAKTIEEVNGIITEAKKPSLNFTTAELSALKVTADSQITSLVAKKVQSAKDAISIATDKAEVKSQYDEVLKLTEIMDAQKTELLNAKKIQDQQIDQKAFSRAKAEMKVTTDKAEVQKIFKDANALIEITDVQRTELSTDKLARDTEIDACEKTKVAEKAAADEVVVEKVAAKEIKLAEIQAKATTASAKATAATKAGSGVNLTLNTGVPVTPMSNPVVVPAPTLSPGHEISSGTDFLDKIGKLKDTTGKNVNYLNIFQDKISQISDRTNLAEVKVKIAEIQTELKGVGIEINLTELTNGIKGSTTPPKIQGFLTEIEATKGVKRGVSLTIEAGKPIEFKFNFDSIKKGRK